MTKIDLSRIITAEDKAAKAAEAHALVAKDECHRRILREFPFEAQQNIAQAMAVHVAEILRGASAAEAQAVSGLGDGDFSAANAGRVWIASMQATCRAMAHDAAADPMDDAAWPAPPEGAVALATRF